MVEQIREVSRNLEVQGGREHVSGLLQTDNAQFEQEPIPEDLSLAQRQRPILYDRKNRTLVFPNGERRVIGGTTVHATLIKLLERPGEVIGFNEIDDIRPKNAKKSVQSLRHAIRDSTSDPKIIISARGVGYFLRGGSITEETVLFDASQEQPPLGKNQDYESLLESLSPTERRLLNALQNNRGNVTGKDELLSVLVGKSGHKTSEGNLRIYIHYLRQKGLSNIALVRGVGYMLK